MKIKQIDEGVWYAFHPYDPKKGAIIKDFGTHYEVTPISSIHKECYETWEEVVARFF